LDLGRLESPKLIFGYSIFFQSHNSPLFSYHVGEHRTFFDLYNLVLLILHLIQHPELVSIFSRFARFYIYFRAYAKTSSCFSVPDTIDRTSLYTFHLVDHYFNLRFESYFLIDGY
jgi:hypothetical protein